MVPKAFYPPPYPLRNGTEPFSAAVFVDDGMFLDVYIGERPELSDRVWGRGAVLFLGEGPSVRRSPA